jgi:menaquinol-cytochrome c reductase iron-sulfur subunit
MDDPGTTVAAPATTRRTFLALVSGVLATLGSFVLAVPIFGSVIGPAFRRKRRHFAKAAELASLPTDQPVSLTFTSDTRDAYLRETAIRTVWAVKLSSSDVVVYSPICPHLGCEYHWVPEQNHFLCPCHGSVFALDGRVLHGPAPRRLDTLPTKLRDGELLVEWERFKLDIPKKVPA